MSFWFRFWTKLTQWLILYRIATNNIRDKVGLAGAESVAVYCRQASDGIVKHCSKYRPNYCNLLAQCSVTCDSTVLVFGIERNKTMARHCQDVIPAFKHELLLFSTGDFLWRWPFAFPSMIAQFFFSLMEVIIYVYVNTTNRESSRSNIIRITNE